MILDVINTVGSIIDKYLTNKGQAAEAKQQVTEVLLTNEQRVIEAEKEKWIADTKSESPLTRLWRPITALAMLGLFAYMIVLAPFLGTLDMLIEAMQEIPQNFWSLLMIAWGVPAAGRSVEKTVKEFVKK